MRIGATGEAVPRPYNGWVGVRCCLTDQAVDVGDRLCFGEGGFVEFDLVAIFERAHELDTVERAEIQLLLQ